MNPPIGVGTVLDGRFRIRSLIGSGALSSVFEAVDCSTGEVVAVKVPNPGVDRDPLYLSRFRREEDIGRALRHPFLVRVFPVHGKGRPYLVMEKVDGTPLSSLIVEGRPLETGEAVRVAAQILRALEYLHASQVVHRDLKPANVMLFPDGSIRILDLGMARQGSGSESGAPLFAQSFGTPDYMPPEQVCGKSGDARSDLYSLGAMLYEMLTGFAPYPGDDVFNVMHARVVGDPVAPRRLNPSIPPQIEEILLRALERDPSKRYASAAEFLRDLEHPEAVVVTGRAASLKAPRLWRIFWRRIRDFVWTMAAMMAFIAAMIFVAWMWGSRRWH
jgi:serine/threonine-protein kinase